MQLIFWGAANTKTRSQLEAPTTLTWLVASTVAIAGAARAANDTQQKSSRSTTSVQYWINLIATVALVSIKTSTGQTLDGVVLNKRLDVIGLAKVSTMCAAT